MVPESLYRIQLVFECKQDDDIAAIMDALLEVKDACEIDAPYRYGDAFPMYVVCFNINQDSLSIVELDAECKSILHEQRKKTA